MNKELEKIREIFLASDVDEEDKQENARVLAEWDKGLNENRLFLSWQDHDITRQISQRAKESYKEFALILMQNRALTQDQRESLWAKQDACQFILSLTDKDALGEIKQILTAVKTEISRFT